MAPVRHYLLFIFILLAIPFSLGAQEKKVVVVLSGGGAKALAHIGFLTFLEEQNIKIKAIGGASMGALVAALYAVGYSARQIKDMFLESADSWAIGTFGADKAFNFYDFNQDNASFIDLNLLNFRSFTDFLPNNLIASEPLELGLMSYFSIPQHSACNNFDSLFRKLRCYAVEVGVHKKHTFKSGSLVRSLMASMAYPFFLPPQKVGEAVFLDGGIYDNFPVEPMVQEFKPDYVIGSQTSLDLDKNTDNNSFAQLIRLIKKDDNKDLGHLAALSKIWIVNHHNIAENYGTFDFSVPEKIIQQGYDNAKQYWQDSIAPHIAGSALPKEISLSAQRQAYRRRLRPLLFTRLNIHPQIKRSRSYLYHMLSVGKVRKKIWQMPDFVVPFSKLFYDKRLDNYRFSYEQDSSDAYYGHLNIHSYRFLRHNINLGGGIMGGQNGGIYNLYMGYGYSYFFLKTLMQTRLEGAVSNYHNTISLQQRTDIPSRVPIQNILKAGIFSQNFYNWESIFLGGLKNLNFLTNVGYGLYESIRLPLQRKWMLTLNVSYEAMNFNYYRNGNIRIEKDSTDQLSSSSLSFNMELRYNTLDHKQYPSSGSSFALQLSWNSVLQRYFYQGATDILDLPIIASKDPTFIDPLYYPLVYAHIETYPKISALLSLGFKVDVALSNLEAQRDYYATLAVLPHYMPILETQYLFRDAYFSPAFVGTGLQVILRPIRKIPSLSLRLETYFLYKKYNFVRPQNLSLVPAFRMQKAWQVNSQIWTQPIIATNIVWNNRYFPLSVSLNYYPENLSNFSKDILIAGRIHFFFNVAYILNYKRINLYKPFNF